MGRAHDPQRDGHLFPASFAARAECALAPFLAYRKEWPSPEEFEAVGLGPIVRRLQREYGTEHLRSHFRLGRQRYAKRWPIDWVPSVDGVPLYQPMTEFSYYAPVPGRAVGCLNPARERGRLKATQQRAKQTETGCTLTYDQWLKVLSRWAYSCAYCLRGYEVMEHVVPVQLGGWTAKENVVPACKACNARKLRRNDQFASVLPSSYQRLQAQLRYIESERVRWWDEMLERVEATKRNQEKRSDRRGAPLRLLQPQQAQARREPAWNR